MKTWIQYNDLLVFQASKKKWCDFYFLYKIILKAKLLGPLENEIWKKRSDMTTKWELLSETAYGLLCFIDVIKNSNSSLRCELKKKSCVLFLMIDVNYFFERETEENL